MEVHATARNLVDVVKSDTVDFAFTGGASSAHRIYIGTGGTMIVVMPDGSEHTYNPSNNSYINVGAIRVKVASTAADMIAERW